MVRHKARWLLVRIDFESDIKSAANPEIEINSEIEAKDVFRAIHHVVKSEFGIVGAGILEEIKVRLYDPEARIAMIKIPRDKCNFVRAAITFLTEIKEIPVVVSTIAVSASSRTAKISALHELRCRFNLKKKSNFRRFGVESITFKEESARLFELEQRMDTVRSVVD